MYNVLGRPSNAPISDTMKIQSVTYAFEKASRHNNRGNVQTPPGSLSLLFSGDPSNHRHPSPFFFSSPFPCNRLQMDDNIYFAVGFKAYNITRTYGTVGSSYDWTERNINSIVRTTFNEKTKEWIVQTLREKSLTKGNMVKIWKKKDVFHKFF